MEVIINKQDKKVEIKVIGRLDTLASADFQKELEPLMTEKSIDVDLDCSALEYIASSGLRAFLALHKALLANSSTMTIHNVQPVVMQVLKMTGFTNFLTIQ